MGKPKIVVDQVAINKKTGEPHYIKHINISHDNIIGLPLEHSVYVYTVPPIKLYGSTFTPNMVVLNWVVGKSKLYRNFKLLSKKESNKILKTIKILYGNKT